MRTSSIYRSNLSDEKVAFLSEIKGRKELNKDDNTPKAYKRQEKEKEKELDILWQGFKLNQKEEKSPGIYLLTGFIAGALCMFVMTSLLSIGSNISTDEEQVSEQSQFEKKISRKEKMPQLNTKSSITVISADSEAENHTMPKTETYTVKSGDSMSGIVIRFYGKYTPDNVEKIRQANNLTNAHKLSIGQQLIIPLD